MYDWVTHVHTHIAGRCSHRCSYCSVQAMGLRFPDMAAKYSGPVRLLEHELTVNYGTGRTIFLEHLNDLFAADVPYAMVRPILDHCRAYPGNTYVFQSKNPARIRDYLPMLPRDVILGTTIETNRPTPTVSTAPKPRARYEAMLWLRQHTKHRLFVTVEPIMDFDAPELAAWIIALRPDFLNIGADSKGTGLQEPTGDAIRAFLAALHKAGIEVREKNNLERLMAR